VGDERSGSAGAVAVAALQPAGKRAGARLAAGGDGAALRVWNRGTGAPLRPQRELGVAAAGAGGMAAGSGPAAGARGPDRGTSGAEVPSAGSPRGRGAMPTDGGRVRGTPLRYAASRATVCGLAQRHARGPRAHSGRAGTVLENAAAGTGGRQGGSPRTSDARSGHGGRHPASRQPAAGRGAGGDDRPATGTDRTPDGKRAAGAGADDGTNGKGARGPTC